MATTRFATGLIRGALEAADEAGYVMLVLETGGEPARESEAIKAALDRQVDGIIFAAMRAREIFVPDMPVSTPVVMLNATNPRFSASVLPDELEGGRSAVRLLADSGIDSGIVLLGQSDKEETGLFRSETVARRVMGIRSEMQRHGLSFAAEASCWNWEPDEGYRLAKKLLKGRHPVRAFLCMNDRLAFGAYQALADAHLRIPEDVSIVSFDNDEIAAYLRPGLTTIALPHEEMGRVAVELLLSGRVEGEHLVPMPVKRRGSLSGQKSITPRGTRAPRTAGNDD